MNSTREDGWRMNDPPQRRESACEENMPTHQSTIQTKVALATSGSAPLGPGGHAEASAAAPAGGRWWQGGGFITVGLRLAGERLHQAAARARLAAIRLAKGPLWRPAVSPDGGPPNRPSGGGGVPAGAGAPPSHPLAPPAPPGLFDESNSPRSTNP